MSARCTAVVATVAILITACGSSETSSPPATGHGSTSTVAAVTTNPPGVTSTTTMPIPTGVQRVDVAGLDNLLPDLTALTSSATHLVELQNRTLTVSIGGSLLCLGGGDFGLQPDTCGDLASGPGVLTYTDDAETRVYAVLTSDDVSVIFLSSTGEEYACYREPVAAIGPLALSWCENEFAPIIRFELADGSRLEIAIS